MSRIAVRYLVVALLTIAGTISCDPASTTPRPETGETRLRLASCDGPGAPEGSRCGSFTVWENRETREGRTIDLNLMVIPARRSDGNAEPVFMLSGGPGGAATDLVAFLPALSDVRENHDIVLVDQRGTGRSNGLACLPEGGLPGLLDFFLAGRMSPETFKACRDGYDADLTLYTTPVAMDDLDEVRAALGYGSVHLWGGSYGSRAALVYLRRHGEHVKAVTLRAAVPTYERVPLYFAKDSQDALDDLIADCASDPACDAAYPDVRGRLDAVLDRLSETPAAATLSIAGDDVEFEITRDHFAGGLLFLLYHSGMASGIPLIIENAHAGQFDLFLKSTSRFAEMLASQLSLGMFFSVICAEDAPFITAERIETDTRGTFLGSAITERFLEVCESWPRGTLPDGYGEPVKSNVPVLILSGEVDPTAPPRMSTEIARHLSNGKVVTLPNTGHIPSLPGCTPSLIAEFIDTGAFDTLDLSCVDDLGRPPFMLPEQIKD